MKCRLLFARLCCLKIIVPQLARIQAQAHGQPQMAQRPQAFGQGGVALCVCQAHFACTRAECEKGVEQENAAGSGCIFSGGAKKFARVHSGAGLCLLPVKEDGKQGGSCGKLQCGLDEHAALGGVQQGELEESCGKGGEAV